MSLRSSSLIELLEFGDLIKEQRSNYEGGDIDYETSDLFSFLNHIQRSALKGIIEDFSEDAWRELISLYYLGKGDYKHFESAYGISADFKLVSDRNKINENTFEFVPIGLGIASMQGCRLSERRIDTEEEIV